LGYRNNYLVAKMGRQWSITEVAVQCCASQIFAVESVISL